MGVWGSAESFGWLYNWHACVARGGLDLTGRLGSLPLPPASPPLAASFKRSLIIGRKYNIQLQLLRRIVLFFGHESGGNFEPSLAGSLNSTRLYRMQFCPSIHLCQFEFFFSCRLKMGFVWRIVLVKVLHTLSVEKIASRYFSNWNLDWNFHSIAYVYALNYIPWGGSLRYSDNNYP